MGLRKAATVVSAWLALSASAHAAPGDLDPTFSNDGRVAVPSAGAFAARAVALQGDGRIVVAGSSLDPTASSFRLARFTPDGGLDPEFGDQGTVATPVGRGRSQAFDVLVVEGGLVAGGVAVDGEGRDVFALVGYDDRGAVLWETLQPIAGGFAAVADLAHGPGGTILAAGQAGEAMAVARFTAAGVLDTTFGVDGWIAAGTGYTLGLAVEPGGAVVAAGFAGLRDDLAGQSFGVLRLTPAGIPDAGFGSDGFATHQAGAGASFANAVAIAADGAWVAAGSALTADGRQLMALVRGAPAGADPVQWTALAGREQGASATDVIALADGRTLVAGQLYPDAGGSVFASARFGAGGALDASYGAGGIATAGWLSYPYARATAAALQPDGRLVTAGVGCSGGTGGPRCTDGTPVLLLARQLGDPPPVVPVPTPTPTPTPVPPDVTPPTARLSGLPERIRRAGLRRRGLRLRVRASEPVKVAVRIQARRRRGRGHFVLRRAAVREPQRSVVVRLRASRRKVVRARRGPLRLRVRLVDAAGNTATLRRRVVLR